jgi:hypothetical protein
LTVAKLDEIYAEANNDEDTRLNRCEFIGSLIRIAVTRYIEELGNLADCVERLLTHDILNKS